MSTLTEVNAAILNNLTSGDNSVEAAAEWARLIKFREQLKNQ
jgi:hypothetical protein